MSGERRSRRRRQVDEFSFAPFFSALPGSLRAFGVAQHFIAFFFVFVVYPGVDQFIMITLTRLTSHRSGVKYPGEFNQTKYAKSSFISLQAIPAWAFQLQQQQDIQFKSESRLKLMIPVLVEATEHTRTSISSATEYSNRPLAPCSLN